MISRISINKTLCILLCLTLLLSVSVMACSKDINGPQLNNDEDKSDNSEDTDPSGKKDPDRIGTPIDQKKPEVATIN